MYYEALDTTKCEPIRSNKTPFSLLPYCYSYGITMLQITCNSNTT